jgi:putative ABC transport system substrate-binding protein
MRRRAKSNNAAEVPLIQTLRFELVINFKAARSLGIELPATLLASAGEAVE